MKSDESLKGERIVLNVYDDCPQGSSAPYPVSLRSLDDPPRSLRCIGNASLLSASSISIVGQRRASAYGYACADRFSRLAVAHGAVIVTGGALGIESEALRSALDAGGECVVVLGCGCDNPYPARNAGLFQDVIDAGGLIVSQYDWKAAPVPVNFRKRNRVIAALSEAMLVCEAGLPSGSFSACDLALELGKDVLAVPGSIMSPGSAGTNALIQAGAFPVIDDASFSAAMYGLGFFGT